MNGEYSALSDVLSERLRQRGIYSDELEDDRTRQQWAEIIDAYVVGAVNAGGVNSVRDYREQLAKIAATALSALESSYRQDGIPERLTR